MLAKKYTILICIISVIYTSLFLSALSFSQDVTTDEKIIERYKLMLIQKPKEGSTFDRLYQFYLEDVGLDAMVSDYQSEVKEKPDNPNLQLILGHIYKRLGKDKEALTAYQRAVALSQNDYYAHFALGQLYVILRQYEDAMSELTKAVSLSEQARTISPEELTDIYKTLGQAYFSRDMLDEAIKAWEKISALDPDDIFARIELADLFREQGLYLQAIAQYEAIISIKKDDTYRKCLSMREIGKLYEESGEYENALKQYDGALDLTATGNWLRKDLQQRIISIYSADANWKDLIAYYKGKLDTNPNDTETLGLLAGAYIENQQLNEGIDTYKKGLELSPTDTGLRLNLIGAYRDAEKYEDAATEYEALSLQQPDDIGIYRELGKLYLQLENEAKAKEVYQRMIARDPESANIYLTLAEIYTGHEWLEDAVAAYEKAIELDPVNLDYIEFYGEFYYRQGDRKKSIETWNQMVADTKNSAENYDRLARLYETKKFSDEAIGASRKAVELMPETYRFREALAKRLMDASQYDEALLEYTEAVKLAPNTFFAEQMDDKLIELYKRQGTLHNKIEEIETELDNSGLSEDKKFVQQKRLAKMYMKLGNTTYALELLLDAIKLQPNDISVNRWTANLYVKQGRYDEAITIYRQLTEIDNANAREYYSNIADIHLEALNFEEATAAAKQVIAHSPRNPEGHQLLAQIAMQSGDIESSVDSFKQAIRLRPEAIDIRIELAKLYNASGKFRLAIAQYWRCWNLSNSVSDKLSFIDPLGEAYHLLGRRSELADRLKQMAKSNTSGIVPVLALAQVYRNDGDLSSARFQLARALDQQRNNPELLYQLVGISLDLGDIDEALSYQQQLVKADPDPIHLQKLGVLLFDLGREQEAVQTWSKVLHQKKHTLDAEIRLAKLLIRHGLVDEAIFALDNAAEKISDSDVHIGLYQIGSTLVGINEQEKAIPYFQRVIDLSKPDLDQNTLARTKKTKTGNPNSFYGPPGINTNKLHLASILSHRVTQQHYSTRSVSPWVPTTFEEAQAASLVHLRTILEDLGQLDEMLVEFEENVTTNPNDLRTLELLAQLYLLMGDHEKSDEVINRLIDSSPDDLVYQGIKLRSLSTGTQFSYETFVEQIEKMTGLSTDAKNWFMIEYVTRFHRNWNTDDVEKILDEIEVMDVLLLSNGFRLVDLYVRMGRTAKAEKILSDLSESAVSRHSSQFIRNYETIMNTYLSNGETDKAIEFFWKYVEKTNPKVSSGRHTASLSLSPRYSQTQGYQTSFPSHSIYYNQARLDFLQKFFTKVWIKDQQELFYTSLEAKYSEAEGRSRIYPALAISYCQWWNGQRTKAVDVLHQLQEEFPDDQTLKMNTIFVSIQSGKHDVALEVLKKLIQSEPKNVFQYYDLTLQIATYSGDSSAVRELMKHLLNSPISVQQLYSFSKKLQTAGFVQSAVAVSQKAMDLAMRERDPNFLRKFSNHLNDLGRGQDAARLLQRAVRLEDLKAKSTQALPLQAVGSMTYTPKQLKVIQAREAKLVKIAEQNPKSFKAQSNLAEYYASRNLIPKAIETYEAALKLRPNDSTLRNQFAEMLRGVGNLKKAVEQYTYLLKNNIVKTQYGYYNSQVIIDTFIQAGETDQLISLAKDLIAESQTSGSGHEFVRRLAQHFRNRNQNVKPLIEIYEKSLESGNETFFNELVSSYMSMGNLDKAKQLLVSRLKTGSREGQVNVIQRLSEIDGGLVELNNLTTEYEAQFPVDTAEPSMLYLLSILNILTNDIEGSDVYVDKLKLVIPKNARLRWFHIIANNYQKKSQSDRQLRILEAALEDLDPNNTSYLTVIYESLGRIYADKGEKEKAKKVIHKYGHLYMIRSGSSQAWGKESVAQTYMRYGMYDEAEVLLIEVINDLSAQSYYKERAQENLTTLRIRRDGPDAATNANNQMEGMNIASLRMQAVEYKRRGDNLGATTVYERIVEAVPDDLASKAALASLYTEQDQHDESIDLWQELLKIDPENTKFQDGLVVTYKEAGRIGEAIQFAQVYTQENPDIGLYHARLADLYATNDQDDDAIAAYKKAIELTPSDAKSHEELAKVYKKIGDYDAAEKAYNEALRNAAPGNNQNNLRVELVRIYQQQGKLEEFLKKAEEQGTLTYEMQRERAKIYQGNGENEKAISAYQKALDMTKDKYARNEIQRNLITLYSNLGKLDEYIKETEEKGVVSLEMQKAVAQRYENKREYAKAAEAYKKALQMNTQSHERYQLSREMMRMMRQSGKFEQFLKEMEKDGTLTSEMQMELARHYSSTGKSKEAIEIYTKAYDMTNSTGEKSQIAAQLMYEHVRLGDNDKSIEVYEKLIANASGRSSSTSYNSISGFRIESENDQVRGFLITAFQQNKKLNELVAIYETKLESKPEDPDILKLIAEIHRSAKRYVKAAEVYQSLIKIEPNSVQHYYLAAASLYKREQIDQANELIKQGQSVLSSSPRSKEMTFLLTLGSICYEGKMYEPAIALFEDALSISEVSALNNSNRWQSQNTYELLGQSYMRIKQYEKAVENYQYVKKIARNSYTRENADKAIKRAYDEGNLYEKQIPKQLEKVKQNPDDVNARITLAKSYVSSARFDEAIVQYEKIAELQPNSSKWHKTVGDLYEKVDKIDTTERYKKAAEAYQKAIALEPDSVDLSLTLAKLHEKNGDAVKAEEVYVRTFNIANNSSEQDTIVNAIIDLHNPKTLSKRLKILEDLQPKAMKSGLLNEALGYAYLGVGDNDKAEHYFREWLKTKLASGRNALGVKLERLAARLIEEHKLPVIAIEAARQFVQLRKTSKSYTTLGTAYMLNEQYDEAFKQFESSFNLLKRSSNFQSNQLDALLEQLSQAGKYIKDKTKFMELMGKVVGSIPKGIPMTLESNLQLAEFCLELKLHDKAHELMQKTGFFPETAWATLGPFDNTKGVGYSTAFIPEEESQIDKTAEYDGATSKIRWSKSTDETLDGFMEFGQDEQFYAAYAWISFTSPEEREAEIRFDSDDQGKVFLNGKKVYAHRRTRGATVDRRTIPITLVSGENTILVKVCNESLPWGFYLRITDTDGKPFDDLKVTDPE